MSDVKEPCVCSVHTHIHVVYVHYMYVHVRLCRCVASTRVDAFEHAIAFSRPTLVHLKYVNTNTDFLHGKFPRFTLKIFPRIYFCIFNPLYMGVNTLIDNYNNYYRSNNSLVTLEGSNIARAFHN